MKKPSSLVPFLAGTLAVAGGAFVYGITLFAGLKWGWVLGSVAVAFVFAASFRKPAAAAGCAGAAVLIGGMAARGFDPGLLHAPTEAVLLYARDAVGPLFEAYLKAHLAPASTTSGSWQIVALATLLAALVAFGCGWAVVRSPGKREVRTLLSAAAVLCSIIALWLGGSSAAARVYLSVGLEHGTYAHDGAIMWRTYDFVRAGDDYYPALVRAASGDTRLQAENAVRDGKFHSWASSASALRLPYSPRLWALAAPSGADGLLTFALVLATCVVVMAYLALLPYAGPTAAFAALLLAPYLQGAIGVGGLFMPDLWAGMFVALAAAAWLRRWFVPAAVLALCAALMRETAALLLVCFVVYAAYRAFRREPGWLVRAAVVGACTALFGVLYAVHLKTGSAYVVATNTPAGTVLTTLATSARRSLADKFLGPAGFGFVMSALLWVPPSAFVVLQLPGWYAAIGRARTAAVPVAAYGAMWLLVTLTIGGTSAYWGTLYMPVALLGTGLLLGKAVVLAQSPSRTVGTAEQRAAAA